jgi:hypothetical protein
MKTETEVRALADKLNALRDLQRHPGWSYYMEAIDRDILAASYALGDNPRMPVDEIHFRRGAIYASRNFQPGLAKLITSVENDVMLESAMLAAAEQPTPETR